MTGTARAQIEAHRLMRKPQQTAGSARVDYIREEGEARKRERRRAFVLRTYVHVGAFVGAFVFTAGVALIGILLWVRPDALLSLVLVGITCSLIFVSVFALIRVVVLHKLMNPYAHSEDDPGMDHHIGKSIAYGLLALVLALLLTGFLVNLASAFS